MTYRILVSFVGGEERSEVVSIRADTRQEFIFIRLNNSTAAPRLSRIKLRNVHGKKKKKVVSIHRPAQIQILIRSESKSNRRRKQRPMNVAFVHFQGKIEGRILIQFLIESQTDRSLSVSG